MLTIKDFKTNDPAVILTMNHGRNEDPVISEVKIGSVGRKYVTINNGPFEKNFQNWNAEYLHEASNYGERSQLFMTREAAEQYIEKEDLALWLGTLSVSAAGKYSLETLRKVKELLSTDLLEEGEVLIDKITDEL